MTNEQIKPVDSLIKEGQELERNADYGNAKICYLEAFEELSAIKEADADFFKSELFTKSQKKVDSLILEVNEKLALANKEKGLAALSNKSWSLAIELLEEATNLAKVDSIELLEEIKIHLDKARRGLQDSILYQKLTPSVSRGDDFRNSGNFAEAVVEYQDAVKLIQGLPESHRFVRYINNCLLESKRSLIRPYLAKVQKAYYLKRYFVASKLLQNVSLLVDGDNLYEAFLKQIKNKIDKHLKQDEVEETEEFASSETWEKAIKDYDEALSLYSSYSVVDPLSPAYTGANIYEDKFVESRKKLGRLYKHRADVLRDKAQVDKAIKNYKEALKLLPKTDKNFHKAFKELKKLRLQIPVNIAK